MLHNSEENNISWDPAVVEVVEIFPHFLKPNSDNSIARTLILSQLNQIRTLTQYFLNIHFNITLIFKTRTHWFQVPGPHVAMH